MRRWQQAMCLVGLAWLSGCPRSPDRDPLETALRYLDAAVAGDVETCYGLLSDDARRQCDRSCLASVLDRQRSEFRAARDELRASLREKSSRGTIQQTNRALVQLGDGSELVLTQPTQPVSAATRGAGQSPAYRFAQSPLTFYPQDTPERALRSFLLAIERRRWDVLVSFLPRTLSQPPQGTPYTAEQIRQRFEGPARPEINRQLAALRQHLGDAIQISASGSEATLVVGDKREARLLLEDGAWRVSRLE